MLDIGQPDPGGPVGKGVQAFGQQIRAGSQNTVGAPGMQALVGFQQQIHGRHQEISQAQDVTLLRQRCRGDRQLGIQLFQQPFAARDHLRGTCQRGRQRPFVEFGQSLLQQLGALGEQAALGLGEGDMGELVFLGQPLQRRRQFGHRRTARHMGTALEGVQGAQEIVGDRLGTAGVGRREETAHGFQVRLGFGAEDIQQLGIGLGGGRCRNRGFDEFCHGQRSCRGRGRATGRRSLGQGFVAGQRVGRVGQPVDVVTLPLTIRSVFRDQLRQQRAGLLDHRLHGSAVRDAVIQPAIEQILQRPGQFADDQRLDHAATALEGVEVAPQFTQRGALLGLGLPGRQPALQLGLDLAGLFDKDLAQLLLDRLGIGRGRQQRLRHLRRRRIDGVDRRRQHLGDRLGIGGRRRQAVQLDAGQQLLGLCTLRLGLGLRRFIGHRGRVLLVRLGRGGRRFLRCGRLEFDQEFFVGVRRLLDRQGGRFQRLFSHRLRRRWQFFGQLLSRRLDLAGGQGRGRRLAFAGRPGRIAESDEAFVGDVENHVVRRRRVFRQALQVVLDAGDGVGQGVQTLPVGHGLLAQQLLADVVVGRLDLGRGPFQRNHRQAATDLGQQQGHRLQVNMVPLGGDELDDGVLGLLQAVARLAHHHPMQLIDVGGGQPALLGIADLVATDHAGQGGFDIEQRPGDIHEGGVAGLAHAFGQFGHGFVLFQHHLARLPEAQHRQGIGDLLERRQEAAQAGRLLAIAAHEKVQAVLDLYQLFAQRGHHRAHGFAIRTDDARTLEAHQLGIRQGLVETIVRLERGDARTLHRRLGQVEQQILQQIGRRRLVEGGHPIADESLEFTIQLPEQTADRAAVVQLAGLQQLGQTRRHRPERAKGRAGAELIQPLEDPQQIVQVQLDVAVAEQSDLGALQRLAQLAQAWQPVRRRAVCQFGIAQRQRRGGQIRREQAGFREQLFPARRAQIVEQRQDGQWQIAAGLENPVQIGRHLQDGLHQDFQRLVRAVHPLFVKGLQQQLHLFGEQRGAIELHHLQRAVDLVHIGPAETQAATVVRVVDERLERLAGLLQGFGDLSLDPLEGYVVVSIDHLGSCHAGGLTWRVNARTSG